MTTPATAEAHHRADRMRLLTRLHLEHPYRVPPTLPDQIAAGWRFSEPADGLFHLEISSRWYRPMHHFHLGSYDLTAEVLDLAPPQLPQRETQQLVLMGLTTCIGSAPVLQSTAQVLSIGWAGSRWALGSHITPPPAQLELTLIRKGIA